MRRAYLIFLFSSFLLTGKASAQCASPAPTVTNGSRCGTGTVALSASRTSAGVFRWYAALTGGTALRTSGSVTTDNFTTPSISTTNTYYVTFHNGTCESTPRTAVTATVNALPVAPTFTAASRCGAGTVSLTASSATAGTFTWYSALTGGTVLQTSAAALTTNSFTTPSISVTTTYYVTFKSAANCESTPRTAVTATVNALPTAPTITSGSRCGIGTVILSASSATAGTFTWYSASTGGTLLQTSAAALTTNSFTTPSISATTTYYVTFKSAANCESTPRTAVVATINPLPTAPTVTAASRCGAGTVILAASSATAGTFNWYSALTGGTVLQTSAAALTSNTFTTPSLSATTTYYVTFKSAINCESSLRTAVTATINAVPPAPTSTAGSTCGAGTVTLAANSTVAGTFKWYDAATGGTLLQTSAASLTTNNFTTPSISVTTTYYVSLTNSVNCESATRTAVIATVNTGSPATAPTVTNKSRCGNGTVALSATSTTAGIFKWYNALVGGTLLQTSASATSNNFTTPSLSAITTYYVTFSNGTCESTPRKAVVATINPAAVAPAPTGGARCGAGTVTLSATSTIAGTFKWYSALTSGTTLRTSAAAITTDSYTTLSIAATTTYYITITNASGCESSPRIAVMATVNTLPTAEVVTGNGAACSTGLAWNAAYAATTPTSVKSTISGLGASASSVERLTANTDGWIEFTTFEAAASTKIAGLSAYGSVSGGFGTVDYAIYMSQASLQVQEDGAGKYAGGFAPGDLFRIERASGTVRYYQNGTLIYTSLTPSTSELVLDIALDSFAPIDGIQASFATPNNNFTVTLGNSATGVNYQLKNAAGNVGAPLAGTTGQPLQWVTNVPGTYTVVATNATTSCTNTMTGSATISVLPMPRTFFVTGGGASVNGSGKDILLSGSQANINYQLQLNGANIGISIAGTSGPLTWAGQTQEGIYTVIATNTSNCTQPMAGSASITNGLVSDQMEYLALKDLFTSTNGANWTNKTNWPTTWPATATSAQFATWFGVGVVNGDVKSLSFQSNHLVGVVPASMGDLKAVYFLDLTQNQLTGILPTSLNQLAELQQLWLSGNAITGDIPDLSGLTKLAQFDMSENVYLNPGPVPAWLNTPNITNFGLRSTHRTGSFPNFSSAPNLFYIDLTNNELSGPLPEFAPGTLSNLKHLFLNSNQLSGSIPSSIGNLTNLISLYLQYNQFTGDIPSSIGSLANLTALELYSNKLTGQIPRTIGSLINLQYLYLWDNQLTGALPTELSNCKVIREIAVNNNQLSELEQLDLLPALNTLNLHNNSFAGAIPDWTMQMPALSGLTLNDNQFAGTIPSSINLPDIRYLYLYNNQLTGEIPLSVSNLTTLAYFRVENNKLTGPLPDLSRLPLVQFIANYNQLSGPLLTSYFSDAMVDFQMNSNQFSGSLPDINHWPNISAYLVAGNQFTGEFPSFDPTLFPNLFYIGANGNKLTSIPASVLNTPTAYYYGFADNQITEIRDLVSTISATSFHPNANNIIPLENNQLDFSQLELLKGVTMPGLTYAPQDIIKDFSTIGYTTSSLVIPARPTGQYSTVVWEKQQPDSTWINVNALNEDATQKTFKKTNPSLSDIAVYRWSMTNTLVTGMTIRSTPIYLRDEGTVADAIEYQALKELYANTNGANWVNKTNWPAVWPATASSAEFGTWFGVTVVNKDISEIAMNSNGLTGVFPQRLFNLLPITKLTFRNNALTGQLPAQVPVGSKLNYLDILGNQFTGSLPTSIDNWAELQVLNIWKNKIAGPIPPAIGNLQSIYFLCMGYNQLSSTIPDQLYNLANVYALYLNDNKFEGSLSSSIERMTSLNEFWCFRSGLSGTLPASLGNMISMRHLYLFSNGFAGEIPTNWKKLVNMEDFWIHFNDVTGPIPDWMGDWTKLSTLVLGDTKLTGPIPASFSKLTNLTELYMERLAIAGPVPDFLQSLTKLTLADLKFNNFEGTVPAWLMNMPSMKTFILNNNKFTGLPDFSARTDKASLTINLENNAFLVADIERYFTAPNMQPFKKLTYSPQVGKVVSANLFVAENGQLKIESVQSGAHNIFTWQKQDAGGNWVNVTADNQGAASTFTVSLAAPSRQGIYRYKITNTWLGDFEVTSDPVTVTITDPISATTSAPVLYNGLITTARWRTDKAYQVAGEDFSGMYHYDYDEKYQLKEALFAKPNFAANTYVMQGNTYRLTAMSYDPNGNIQALKRYTDNGQLQHNFATYAYEANTNKLLSVSNYASYTYNAIGQMTSVDKTDANEKDQYVDYDVTGKVVAVYKSSSKVPANLTVKYTYDDRGFRLSKEVYDGQPTPAKITWYIRDASGNVLSIYEQNGTGAPTQTEVPIYGAGKLATYYPAHSVAADDSKTDAGSTAYEITDHLGNVRALVRVQTNEYTATMEDDGTATYANPRVRENVYFKNLFATEKRDAQMNHTAPVVTPSPNTSAYLYWISGQAGMSATEKSVGPAIALSVSPGDQIDLSAWARFKIKDSYTKAPIKSIIASTLTGEYVFSNGLESITQAASALNAGVLAAVPMNPDDPNAPRAYLNYVVFNSSYGVVNGGAWQVPASAGFEEAQRGSGYNQNNLIKFVDPLVIGQTGYVYIWVSNESENTEVWFDDVSVIHHKPLVAQATDYEAWGGVLREQKWIDMDAKYRYGYQGKYAEKDDETGWNHFELREYDPIIGRWTSKDPAGQYHSPYVAMGNNPVNRTDPDGGTDGPGDDAFKSLENTSNQLGSKINFSMAMLSARKSQRQGPNSLTDLLLAGVGTAGFVAKFQTSVILNSRAGFTSGRLFPNSSYIYSKANAGKIYVGARVAGAVLTAFNYLNTERQFRTGAINQSRREYNHLNNTYGLFVPTLAIPMAAGDYLGQKYSREIENDVTQPGGFLFEGMKFTLELFGLPTSPPRK
ncbi:MAG: RHS repeat-associated core domain-containing protein [Cyclobacteriaceae bacterium]